MDSLKASAEEVWATMLAECIRKTCAQFRPKLEAMIAAKGWYIEK